MMWFQENISTEEAAIRIIRSILSNYHFAMLHAGQGHYARDSVSDCSESLCRDGQKALPILANLVQEEKRR